MVTAVPYVASGRYMLGDVTEAWRLLSMLSLAIGVPVELIVVTPMLVTWRLLRRPWPNLWIAGGLGVLIMESLGQLLSILAFDHHHHHEILWSAVLHDVAVNGFVGLTAAMAFHLIAFRPAGVGPTSPAARRAGIV